MQEAANLTGPLISDYEHILGPDHPDTLEVMLRTGAVSPVLVAGRSVVAEYCAKGWSEPRRDSAQLIHWHRGFETRSVALAVAAIDGPLQSCQHLTERFSDGNSTKIVYSTMRSRSVVRHYRFKPRRTGRSACEIRA